MKPTYFLPLILLLAGCAEGPAVDTTEDAVSMKSAPLEWHLYRGNFTLTINKEVPAAPAGSDLGTRDNCVMMNFGEFGRDWYEIREGSATLTWTPQDPLSASIHLVIFRGDDGHQEEFDGDSPVTGAFSSDSKKMKWAYAFSVETGLQEMPRQQEVMLELQFKYLTEHEINIGLASCNMML